MRTFDDGDAFDSGLSMVKVNEVSPAVQEQVDLEIKRLLQVCPFYVHVLIPCLLGI